MIGASECGDRPNALIVQGPTKDFHLDWHKMSFFEAMKRVEKHAIAHNAQLHAAWESFYEICTIEDVCYCIRDYLADFSFSGERVRRKYELEVSICFAEALSRAGRRQHAIVNLEPVREALNAYNSVMISRETDEAETADLSDARLALATALLTVD